MFDDYSLIKLRSRLAAEGEELIAHRFHSGAIGMVPRSDFERWRCSVSSSAAKKTSGPPDIQTGFWQSIKSFCADFLKYYGFVGPDAPASDDEPRPVVGIPSEALLRVFDISPAWQEEYHFGAFEDALFIEFSPSPGVSRKALCFGNGVVIALRLIDDGQKVKVLRRSWAESLEPEPELVQVKS
ncbi:MAG TPA: hypothetical protein VKW78_05040 [Terriglobales bacterium]|nr:hypothetical protein [Terriglobales bacterium]